MIFVTNCRACALYKDMTDTEPAPSNVGNSRTLTELSISAESWQSTLLLMEKVGEVLWKRNGKLEICAYP